MIKTLPNGSLTKQELLVPQFQLYQHDHLGIYYAPFECTNRDARVVFVGITPGFTQMEISSVWQGIGKGRHLTKSLNV